MTKDRPSLDECRQEIDRIDDAIHDLLMRRSEVVEFIRELKETNALSLLRPAREAEILRRLVARHSGRLPKAVLIHLWRAIIGSMTTLQGEITVAVCVPERGDGYLEMARDHYGSTTPMVVMRSPSQVVRAVAEGSALVGVVPLPGGEEEAWWNSLTGESADLPRIIARLPFAGPGPGRGDGVEGLVIALLRPEATGYDRSILALETKPDLSRDRLRSLVGAAGFEPTPTAAMVRGETLWLHMIEVTGLVTGDDPRLARLIEAKDPVVHCVPLGGYPIPFTPENLNE